jgi:hypothetical protein
METRRLESVFSIRRRLERACKNVGMQLNPLCSHHNHHVGTGRIRSRRLALRNPRLAPASVKSPELIPSYTKSPRLMPAYIKSSRFYNTSGSVRQKSVGKVTVAVVEKRLPIASKKVIRDVIIMIFIYTIYLRQCQRESLR